MKINNLSFLKELNDNQTETIKGGELNTKINNSDETSTRARLRPPLQIKPGYCFYTGCQD